MRKIKCESLQSNKTFILSDKVISNLTLQSGKVTTTVINTIINSNALEVPINLIHNSTNDNIGLGLGWKTSVHQKVFKKGRYYYYCDENYVFHQFEEIFFFTDNNNSKIKVSKDQITVQPNGRFWLKNQNKIEVFREFRSELGLVFNTAITNIKGADYLEQHIQEQQQVKQQIRQKANYLQDLVLVNNKGTNPIYFNLKKEIDIAWNNFRNVFTNNILLNKQNLSHFRSLIHNRDSNTHLNSLQTQRQSLVVQNNQLVTQREGINAQISSVNATIADLSNQNRSILSQRHGLEQQRRSLIHERDSLNAERDRIDLEVQRIIANVDTVGGAMEASTQIIRLNQARNSVVNRIVALNASDGKIAHVGQLRGNSTISSEILAGGETDDDHRPIVIEIDTHQAMLNNQETSAARTNAVQHLMLNHLQRQLSELVQTQNNINQQLLNIDDQIKELEITRNQIIAQINDIIRLNDQTKKDLPEFIKDYKQLLEKERQLDLLVPISQVVNDGILLGFNKFGNLCLISDSFENTIKILYETIGTNHGKIDVITSLGSEYSRCDFSYNLDGQLVEIVSQNGEVSQFEYLNNMLVEINNSENIKFSYLEENINQVKVDHITTDLTYHNQALATITSHTIINKITDSQTIFSDNQQLSSYSLEYNNNKSYVRIFDNKTQTTQYHYLDNEGMSYVNYSTFNDDTIKTPISYTYLSANKSWALDVTQNIDFVPIFEQKEPIKVVTSKKIKTISAKQLVNAQLEYMLTATMHTNSPIINASNPSFRQQSESSHLIRVLVNYTDGNSVEFTHPFNSLISGHQAVAVPITLISNQQVKDIAIYAHGQATFDGFRLLVANWQYTQLNDWQNIVYQETSLSLLNPQQQTYSKIISSNFEHDQQQRLLSNVTTNQIIQINEIIQEDKIMAKQAFNAKGQLLSQEEFDIDKVQILGKSILEYVYDEKGNIIKEIRYNSNSSINQFVTEQHYDERGFVNYSYDDLSINKTKYIFNSSQRNVRIVDPNGGVLGFGFDKAGRLTGLNQSVERNIGNPNYIRYQQGLPTRLFNSSNAINFEYDYQNRPINVLINDKLRLSYEYKELVGESNVGVIVIDKEPFTSVEGGYIKKEFNQEYQLDSWIDEKDRPVMLGNDGLVYQAYHYNDDSTIAQRADGITNQITNFEYDASTKKLLSSSDSKITHNYSYNDKGLLESKNITGLLEREYQYTYKHNNLLEKVILPNKLEYFPKLDLNGRPAGKILKISEDKLFQEKILYPKVGEQTSIIPAGITYFVKNTDVNTRTDTSYSYDGNQNITHIYENNNLEVRYSYDLANRLVREDNYKLKLTSIIDYDTNGNILAKTMYQYSLQDKKDLELINRNNYNYCLDDADRLLSFNNQVIKYNDLGNPLNYLGNEIKYLNNKIIKYGKNTFEFDGYFNRIKKNDIQFIYDNEQTLSRIIDQKNILDFIYDITGVISIVHNDTTYITRRSMFGSITHILDLNGNVVAYYIYDAYGNHKVLDQYNEEINDSNHIGHLNPFRYHGYQYDRETDLYYLKTRYYDPKTGRFISSDHTSFLREDIVNGLNLYAYCGNNPVMNYDPDGHRFWNVMANIGKVIAGSALAVATAPVAVLGGLLPGSGIVSQAATSVGFYGGFLVASAFSQNVRRDMEAIGWNPFNRNERTVLDSNSVSFYRGVPVLRYGDQEVRNGFSFGVIGLGRGVLASDMVRHEWGHNVQMWILGVSAYGRRIGIPSLISAIDSSSHRNMPWERTANTFGGTQNSTSFPRPNGWSWFWLVMSFFT